MALAHEPDRKRLVLTTDSGTLHPASAASRASAATGACRRRVRCERSGAVARCPSCCPALMLVKNAARQTLRALAMLRPLPWLSASDADAPAPPAPAPPRKRCLAPAASARQGTAASSCTMSSMPRRGISTTRKCLPSCADVAWAPSWPAKRSPSCARTGCGRRCPAAFYGPWRGGTPSMRTCCCWTRTCELCGV